MKIRIYPEKDKVIEILEEKIRNMEGYSHLCKEKEYLEECIDFISLHKEDQLLMEIKI